MGSFFSRVKLVLRRILPTFVICAVASMQTMAGQYSDLEDLSLEELMSINVSVGTLFDENELDIANTVDLITHQQWQARGAKNYLDAIGFLPSILPLQNPWGSTVAIRGFATNLSIRGIGNLVDGVAVNNLADMTSGYNETMQILGLLDRIEVLRGPGSALYGSDAFHGVFSLKTFRSDKDVVISRVEMGDLGVHDVSLKISHKINQQWRMNAALALHGQGDQSLEFQYTDFRLAPTDPGLGELLIAERENSLRQWGAVVSLEGTINNRLDTVLSFYVTDRSFDGAIGGSKGSAYGEGDTLGLDKDYSDGDGTFTMLKGGMTYQLDNQLTMSIVSYYWAQDDVRANDVSYVPFYFSFFTNKINRKEKRETAQGVDITFKRQALEGETQWLVQLQHKRGSIDKFKNLYIHKLSGAISLHPNQPLILTEGYQREVNSIAFQGKTPLMSDTVHLMYGGRADYYSDLGVQLTPKAGLIYRPNRNQSFRLNYGQSFRAPSPNELLGQGTIQSTEIAPEPETIDTYEVSFLQIAKKQRYSITFFNSQWNNAIDVESGVYVNKDKRESTGIELGFKSFCNSLNYEINGAFVETQYTHEGNDTGAFPEIALNAIVSYYWYEYDTEITLANRLKVEMKEGPVSIADANPDKLPTYFRADLNITNHLTDDASIWLTMRNLANSENSLPSLWNAEGGYLDESFSVAVGGQIRF